MLDYTISKGSVVETHFPNIKEHKVIISEELEKRDKNELLDKHFKWINSFEKEGSYRENHSDQIDRKKIEIWFIWFFSNEDGFVFWSRTR